MTYTKPRVIISVSGGVAEVVESEGVEVTFRDYDDGEDCPDEIRDRLQTEGEPDEIDGWGIDDDGYVYQIH